MAAYADASKLVATRGVSAAERCTFSLMKSEAAAPS
jgi:hypothetical protein